MARKIRKRPHAKDDTQTQVDVAWAVGMRAGIDEGKRYADADLKAYEKRIQELEDELESHKAANSALRRYNDQHENTIKELRKERGNAMDYIKRLESHLDPRVIQTKLLVNVDGKPFNETSGSEKRLLLAGTETGRLSTGGIIDFKHVRPRGVSIGSRITRERRAEIARAYGASQETIDRIEPGLVQRIVDGVAERAARQIAEDIEDEVVNGTSQIEEPIGVVPAFQEAASRALAEETDRRTLAISEEEVETGYRLFGVDLAAEADQLAVQARDEAESTEEDDGYEKERNDW